MSEVAETVTMAMLGDVAGSGMLNEETEEALGAAQAEQPQETAPATPPSPGEEIVEEARQDSTVLEVPRELAEELDTPDFEEEAALEVEHFNPEPAERFEDASYEYEPTPELQEERRLRIAAEKKAAHFEKLRASEAKKAWRDEALRYFPYSAHRLDSIEATSRKGFLRAARAEHEAVLPYVQKASSPAALEAERERIREEEKQAAIKRWGGHPGAGPSASEGGTNYQADLEAARRTGNLEKIVGVLRRQATEEA